MRRLWGLALYRLRPRLWRGQDVKIGDIDIVELNEAFAAQSLPVIAGT